MECIGMNVMLNVGVIKWDGKYLMLVRVEGVDCKFFFVVVESLNGIDNFCFWEYLVILFEDVVFVINVYDMCFIVYEDGWIYGIFCVEWYDDNVFIGDLLLVIVIVGIVCIKDLKNWECLLDLKIKSQ